MKFEIRANNCTGKMLLTVEATTVEQAAILGAQSREVWRDHAKRRGALGVNRETGTPGLSGIFSLRGTGGANHGAIHVTKA